MEIDASVYLLATERLVFEISYQHNDDADDKGENGYSVHPVHHFYIRCSGCVGISLL